MFDKFIADELAALGKTATRIADARGSSSRTSPRRRK